MTKNVAWFAEVRRSIDLNGKPDHDYYHRPTSDGGPFFTSDELARIWCEYRLGELSRAYPGVDLSAVVEMGVWRRREFVESSPLAGFTARWDAGSGRFVWTPASPREVTP